MALATVSAVVLVSAVWRLYFGPQIPDWVIWEDSAFADADNTKLSCVTKRSG